MKKFMYFLIFLFIFFIALGSFFTSDYANTDYYKPIHPLMIHSKNPLKVYADLTDCYFNSNNWQPYDTQEYKIKLVYFQRDLKGGYHCFKISVNGSIGFTFITNDPAIDAIKIGGETSLFKKTLWP